jgi:hypothetical protein
MLSTDSMQRALHALACLGAGAILVLRSGAVAAAQEQPQTPPASRPTVTIDLAAGESQFWPLGAGTYSVVLVNALPGAQYSVLISAAALVEREPLTFPGGTAPAMRTGGVGVERTTLDLCEDARAAAMRLYSVTSEADIPDGRRNVQQALVTCTDEAARTAILAILNSTVIDVPSLQLQLAPESRRTMTVVRAASRWRVTLSSASRGSFQTLFGWTFAPSRDEEFFAERTGDATFVIKARPRSSGALTSLPAVFFTWLPVNQAFRSLQHGPTAGLGVTVGESGTRPSVFGGYMVRYNQNIGFVGGLAFYPHRRLDSKYTIGQEIAEDLDTDQLNRDVIRVNGFFGVLLRFGTDPRSVPEEGGE